MILWLSQRERYCWFIYKEKSSSQSLCDLHCSKYISSRQTNQKHQSQFTLYRAFQISTRQTASFHFNETSKPCIREFMKSYEEATSRPHEYLMLDIWLKTDYRWPTETKIERCTWRKCGSHRIFQEKISSTISDRQRDVTSSAGIPEGLTKEGGPNGAWGGLANFFKDACRNEKVWTSHVTTTPWRLYVYTWYLKIARIYTVCQVIYVWLLYCYETIEVFDFWLLNVQSMLFFGFKRGLESTISIEFRSN